MSFPRRGQCPAKRWWVRGAAAVGAPSRGGEKPHGPPELRRHGLGVRRVPREGWVWERCPLQLRKAGWSAMGRALPLRELPGGVGGVLFPGKRGAGGVWDARLWGPRRVRHRGGVTTWRPWACRGGCRGPWHRCRAAGGVHVGWHRGAVRAALAAGSRGSCSYLWLPNGGWRKRKSPPGSFRQRFTAVTTVPVPSLRSPSHPSLGLCPTTL